MLIVLLGKVRQRSRNPIDPVRVLPDSFFAPEFQLSEAGIDRLSKETWHMGVWVGLGGCLLGGLGLALLKGWARPNLLYPY